MHTTPTILQLLILFCLLLILVLILQMSVHMRRLEDNGQPLQPGNQLMIKMVERGNRRIDKQAQITQDEEVSDTDTEQQTSEH